MIATAGQPPIHAQPSASLGMSETCKLSIAFLPECLLARTPHAQRLSAQQGTRPHSQSVTLVKERGLMKIAWQLVQLGTMDPARHGRAMIPQVLPARLASQHAQLSARVEPQ
jgi:hypothetical protein